MPLIYSFLTHLAFRYPELTMWLHAGEEECDKVEEAIKQRKLENFTSKRLLGTLQNDDAQEFYLEKETY